ncbi:MAG TPA: biopolymer transporter ExbD [Thiobacillaceae bacterium]
MRFRRPLDEDPEVNLIPLIDVLLIVLIFLAVSTTYSKYAELKIELPTADATQPNMRPNEINVAVTADGRYALERRIIGSPDVQEFADVLQRAAAGKDSPLLVVNADAQAPHQSVISVMEAARLAGIVRISFATQKTSRGRR